MLTPVNVGDPEQSLADQLEELLGPLQAGGRTVHLIGGADVAAELDAKRAIRQGTELAAGI